MYEDNQGGRQIIASEAFGGRRKQYARSSGASAAVFAACKPGTLPVGRFSGVAEAVWTMGAGGASEVEETARGQDNHTMSVREHEAKDCGLMFSTLMPGKFSSCSIWISLSK